MNRLIRSTGLMLVAGFVLAVAHAAPVGAADDAMKSAAMDCAKADTMMAMPPAAMPDSSMNMKPSGDVDKDFAQSMMMHNQAMMSMAKMEVACGKNAKAKAMAQKMVDELIITNKDIQDWLVHTYQ